jgi:alpha-tubulin suppressor-like RCC1 family protein
MTNQYYSLAITDADELFSWGSNKDNRLGIKKDSGEDRDIIKTPEKYEFFTNNFLKVFDVSCGNSHIAVVACSKDEKDQTIGDVYTWGLPAYGRLGYEIQKDETKISGSEGQDFTSDPKKLTINSRVVRVYCGEDFTACITEKGKILTWGTNKWGNLGVENKTFDSDPNIVKLPLEILTFVNKTVIQV